MNFKLDKTGPNLARLIDLFHTAEMAKLKIFGEYWEEGKETDERISKVCGFGQQMKDLMVALEDKGIPFTKLEIHTQYVNVDLCKHDTSISTNSGYRNTDYINVIFNGNSYAKFEGVLDRMLELASHVKDNLNCLSDNSIRKWLKGEVKIPPDKWLNMATTQSLQNRLDKQKMRLV